MKFNNQPSDVTECDVLLTYEIKNREIENLCLLKYELEKRGYSVQIRMQYASFFEFQQPISAKLVVIPAYYRKRHMFYSSSHTFRTEKILNMMWEQVRCTRDEKGKKTIFAIKDWGKAASHIAWGRNMRERLIDEWKCDSDHVFMTGHLALDFLREPLVNYYLSREMLFSTYEIPVEKRAHLFISSLGYADVDMRKIKNSSMGDTVSEVLDYKRLCMKTRRMLLDWFERILSEDENSVIIYRPHPEEKGDTALFNLSKRQKRFFVINDKSVKQWVLACDNIYTWKSTSIVEVTALGKAFNVLRPFKVPKKNDIEMYGDVNHITTFDEFKKTFFSVNTDRGLIDGHIENNYYIPEKRFSYELVCDAIEEIIKNDKYKIVPPIKNKLLKWYYPERIKNFLKRKIAKSRLCEAYHNSRLLKHNIVREWIDDIFYVKEKLEKNYMSDEEISQILSRIKRAMS